MQNIQTLNEIESVPERAILVAVRISGQLRREVEEFLDELVLLADTAGAQVVARFVQERKQIDPTYFIGKGKIKELSELAKKLHADIIVFDDDLTPAQMRNIENFTRIKVIDRTSLILDIFARRAKTREAKTQVELAQLQYLLPRLTRRWTHLSRQEGGIGIRGPGETQLETDRRMIQKRIGTLTGELEKIQKQRDTRRKARKDLFKVALVGYTNTGKSTLLNALTEANILTENRLFVTLDSTIRSFDLDSYAKILLIDTVGFIRKLPHNLIASFRSTLEEATTSDLLLHVVDISHPSFMEQIIAVDQVLKELKIENKPSVLVFNKIDLLQDTRLYARLREKYDHAVFISAKKGYFLQDLIDEIKNRYNQELVKVECVLKDRVDEMLNEIGSLGIILNSDYQAGNFTLQFQISRINFNKLENRLKKRFDGSIQSEIIFTKYG